ncbi:uncharacterized protein RHOBADRAFT_66995 [Rhodotorula graminis WP1]|uniref:LIM zinc-binding domain-containing protein n=1 Tax=Rhodotorula graminis (strain WP1) TaxID=578459 RepID=A0A0P9ERV8_RHOGW|nr:uncharacterized protein RHOBADRAFT_66995 [Rhodotorula graminis WP1]KPV72100.1 hypothetical protein RHOBADRAFT_66995 [Rhodotorula graminis WP1]
MAPRVYGGAPKCAQCGKSVYAAEQALGPAGTYHKLCLKCVECGKLLEPRLLVDHDGQAYCKGCHAKSYGTKGYGAGGALVGDYAPRPVDASPSRPTPSSPGPVLPSRPAASSTPPAVPTRPLFGSPAAPGPPPTAPALPARASLGTTPPPPPSAPVHASRPPPAPARASSPTPAPALPARPAPPPKPTSFVSRAGAAASTQSDDDGPTPMSHKVAAPDFDDDDQRGPLTAGAGRSSLTSPSALAESLSSLSIPTRSRPSLTSAPPSLANLPSQCPQCAKPVYHAERVQALGRAWHRACLRCEGCGTGLGSQPGRVEEKEGRPWCRKCYQDKWGITGAGMTTRPGLY